MSSDWENFITVGSRRPTGAPAWVSCKVHGTGIATGEHSAALAAGDARNDASLEGLHTLFHNVIEPGLFRVDVPEHAALAVVSVLVHRGRLEEARAIMGEISPWLEELRFYPRVADTPLEVSPVGCVDTAGALVTRLRDRMWVWENGKAMARRTAWERAFSTYLPFKWDLVSFAARAVAGGIDAEGAQALLDRYDSLLSRARSEGSNKTTLSKGTVRDLISPVREAAKRGKFTAGEVEHMRLIVAANVAKWGGLPGSDAFVAHFARHAPEGTNLCGRSSDGLARPSRKRVYSSVIERLKRYPADEGLVEEAIEIIVEPVEERAVPASLRKKVERLVIADLDELSRRGLVGSGEVLGQLVPQLVASLQASAIEDPVLARVYHALHLAFRKRRSLLLLNLASQVKIDELPWAVPCLASMERSDAHAKRAAAVLRMTALRAFQNFPGDILPNKLVSSLVDLAKTAGINVPLTKEIAADIFCGAFSDTFARASEAASDVFDGTVYSRYYAISVFPTTASHLLRDCESRSGYSARFGSVAENGCVLEQCQILTTHNIAALVPLVQVQERDGADDDDDDAGEVTDGPAWRDFAFGAWDTVVRSATRIGRHGWHNDLILCKKAAYAMRQLVAFAALARSTADDLIPQFRNRLESATLGNAARFKQLDTVLIQPLDRALRGEQNQAADPLLGWTTGRHPLMPCKN